MLLHTVIFKLGTLFLILTFNGCFILFHIYSLGMIYLLCNGCGVFKAGDNYSLAVDNTLDVRITLDKKGPGLLYLVINIYLCYLFKGAYEA